MKFLIPLFLSLACAVSLFGKTKPTLNFQMRYEEGDDSRPLLIWASRPDARVRVSGGNDFQPTESSGLLIGSEVDSFYHLEENTIIYAVIFRQRELKHSDGDPESQLIASFEPLEYFLCGTMEIGGQAEFPLEDGKRLILNIFRRSSDREKLPKSDDNMQRLSVTPPVVSSITPGSKPWIPRNPANELTPSPHSEITQ